MESSKSFDVFNLTKPFGYFETFTTIFAVVLISFLIFYWLKRKK